MRASSPPPFGPIQSIAEYEPCTGVLIRYPLGLDYAVINEMAEDVNVTIHVIVSSSYYSEAVTNFLANSIDTSRCEFIVEPSNSIWTRDYGPWFVFDGHGDQVIIDHYYNRPRPDDDVIPIALGARWGIPVVTHNLWHAGGNYMTEGDGQSFSSDMVWDENWNMTPQEIAQFFLDYYGVEAFNVIPDISEEGIHHIDTWGKLLNEETVLLKQVAPSHPDYARIEANAVMIAGLVNQYGRPFKVVRVFCPPIPSGNVAPYTNSFILNNKVLVPLCGQGLRDLAALQVYRANMPGYEVVGIPGGWLSDDALHCRVIGIYDRYMLRVDHDPVQSAGPGLPIPVTMYIDPRPHTNLDMSATNIYWRVAGAPAWTEASVVQSGEKDWFRGQIPWQMGGTQIQYYVSARDETGRVSSMPRPAPIAWYNVHVDATTDVHPPDAVSKLTLAVAPSPFQDRSVVRFDLATAAPARVTVYDVRGREVARLVDRMFVAGSHEVEWMGRATSGAQAPSGVYFVVLQSAGERITRRVVLLR